MIDSIRAKKSLGQNFLKDPHYLCKIADAAQVCSDDQVLEIGPGLGHLTAVLAKRANCVLALELDTRLIPVLEREFGEQKHISIVHADALEYPYGSLTGRWKAVANLPYYISTPIIQLLITHRDKFTSLTLLLQKEVAQRIASPPGSKEYGFLSVLVQLSAEPRIEFMVPASAFTPVPKVDSAVVTLRMREHPAAAKTDKAFLVTLLKAVFSQRRKTLRNGLKPLGLPPERIDAVTGQTGIDLSRRAETLSVEEFCALAGFLRTQ
jgi:16S rRNA (adenine1518-N6/adenine1519-N6)-dimethyltransferase